MADAGDRLKAALADRYRIERELGAGGMATVYLAEDLKHDRKVAVKVLRPDLAAALGPERFLREVKIAANLTHPHILPLHDSGQADGVLYYVMPYVEGTSLRQKLLREGELPISDAVRILRDVADAMAYAHQHGVVHRDIKPENVMLSGRHALVTDFGVAKAVSEATGRQSLTTAGVALGTPTYMAPEQATADPHTDHRADIYAFGVMAYELLTGRPPFTGPSPQAVLAAHVTSAAEPVNAHRMSIPPLLTTLVMKCLEKKPADRWQSAEELLPQLEMVLTPSTGMTPAQTQPLVAVTQPARRSWRTGLAAGLAAAVVVLLVVVMLRNRTGGSGPSASTDRSVAVLAFRMLSSDTAQNYLSLGLADDIATTLSRIEQLAVKTPSAVARAQSATPGDLAAIGRALQVRYLVDGSLRQIGDSLRISARLVESISENETWADTYDRVEADLPRVAPEIARDLAQWLKGSLRVVEREALVQSRTQNALAYQAYLRGNVKLLMRDERANQSGMLDYQQARSLDPTFWAARARIAMMAAQQHDYGWIARGVDTSTFLKTALAHADSAIEGSPELSDGWTAKCYVLWLMGQYRGALDACDRSLQISPDDLEGHLRRGWILLFRGQDTEAAAEAARIREIDPTWHMPFHMLGWIAFVNGRLADARRHWDELLRRVPHPSAFELRGRVRLLMGDTAGARQDLGSLQEGFPNSPELPVLQGLLAIRTGQTNSARELAAKLSVLPTGNAPVFAATIYAAMMDTVQTVRVLESRETSPWLRMRTPEFDPFRSVVSFQRVVTAAQSRDTRR